MTGHVAINFHYVGMPAMPHPGIHGLDADTFRATLGLLANERALVSLTDLREALDGARPLPDRACLITFDDGLRCQAEVALPILDELGIPAAFFALGGPYARGRAATVHKLHYVRASFGDAAVADSIPAALAERGEDPDALAAVDEATACEHYRYDEPAAARLKYFLNYLASAELTETVTDRLLDAAGIPELRFIRDYYMDEEALRLLAGREFLGSHAVSHRPLARMADAECRDELRESRAVLEGITGSTIDAISYPLGNAGAVDRRVGRIADECGYRLGWTMERAENLTLRDSLLLARVDAADRERLSMLEPRSRYGEEDAA